MNKKYSIIFLFAIISTLVHAQRIKVTEPIFYLALGDSYTIGQSVNVEERWPVILSEALKARGVEVSEVLIRARTGWTTGNLIASLDDNPVDIEPNLVSLLIGVNNQYQGRSEEEYTEQFETLLKRSLDFVQDDKASVFVLSIPDYAYTPFGGGATRISEEIDAFNMINETITKRYGITYINITEISREGLDKPEYVAGDGLHPSGFQYTRWVDLIMPLIDFSDLNVNTEKYSEYKFEVFPNPFQGQIQIQVRGIPTGSRLEIIDITGRIVATEELWAESMHMDLSHLSAGVYYLRIGSYSGLRSVSKIIKK
jgi:lysophospholipase L1-like esterase